MSTYYMNEGAFEFEGFEDKTAHALEATLPGGELLTLLVVRTKFPAGKSLAQAVAAHLKQQAIRLTGYTVLDQREAAWAGLPVIEVRARWRHEGEAYYERCAHLAIFDLWMFYGLTGPLHARDACEERMDRIRDTIRFRDPM
jgi:hypothetical protein